MTLSDIQQLFNRALALSFEKTKLLLASAILALCGVLVVFFQTLAIDASRWVGMSLVFIPLFLCAGVLLSAGILFIRIYHDEIKQRKVHYSDTLDRSWGDITLAFYSAVPVVLCYLIVWMALGVFVLLKETPGIGDFFGAILVFAPFLLNLSAILLALASLLLLYFFAPLIAFKGFDRTQLIPLFVKRVRFDVFYNLLFGVIALLPLLFCLSILVVALYLTGSLYAQPPEKALYHAIQSFFLMLPFVVLLSPAVIFFFNFSAEAHVYMQKLMRQ